MTITHENFTMRDPFATFGVPRAFDLDRPSLESRHKELARATHPDRFAASSGSERRQALERASEINAAWRVLRDPVQRAETLFSLSGMRVGEACEPKPSFEFLEQCMEDREALSEARRLHDTDLVERIATRMRARSSEIERAFADAFSPASSPTPTTLEALVPMLGEYRFCVKFLEECEELLQAVRDDHLVAASCSRLKRAPEAS